MNSFFKSIADANRAYCAMLGLSTAELYGTAPNQSEIEVHDLIESGVPAEAADPRMDELASRLEEIGRMPKPARMFRACIEYARCTYVAPSAEELAASNARMQESMAKDEACHTKRFGSGVRNSWAGD